jgi:hypothetical protein
MGERGRDEAAARTTGRRKVLVEKVERREVPTEVWKPAVPPFPAHYGPDPNGRHDAYADLIGSCGHLLKTFHLGPTWPDPNAALGDDCIPDHLQAKVGRRMTCPHPDCEIERKPPREERDTDCTWSGGTSDDVNEWRRCRVTAKWDTDHGPLCTRHRDRLLREGYLNGPGTPIEPGTTRNR